MEESSAGVKVTVFLRRNEHGLMEKGKEVKANKERAVETLKEKANHSMGAGGGREEEGRQIRTGGKGGNEERKGGKEKEE